VEDESRSAAWQQVSSQSTSLLLQGSTQDILTTYEEVKLVKDVFTGIREKAEAEFKELYSNAKTMGELVGMIDLPIPRRCGQQTL